MQAVSGTLGAPPDRMESNTVIYHGVRKPAISLDEAGTTPRAATWRPAATLLSGLHAEDHAAVLLVDASLLDSADALRAVSSSVVVIAVDAASERALGKRADLSIEGIGDARCRARLLNAACDLAMARMILAQDHRQIVGTDNDFRMLNRVGIALSSEHDRPALLRLIVMEGIRLTESDGAGILLAETDAHGVTTLRPTTYEFTSIIIPAGTDICYALDSTSIIGHAAVSREAVVLADAHGNLPAGAPFSGRPTFEARFGYFVRSMMAVPMVDQRDKLLGVMFFVNHKRDPATMIRTEEDCNRHVLSYSDHEVRLARSLASQAAISIENTNLYQQIEELLESFITAAVTGIDDRDPSTAGHSLRVAVLTTELAKAVERSDRPPYNGVHFTAEEMRELRYAAFAARCRQGDRARGSARQGEETSATAAGTHRGTIRFHPAHHAARGCAERALPEHEAGRWPNTSLISTGFAPWFVPRMSQRYSMHPRRVPSATWHDVPTSALTAPSRPGSRQTNCTTWRSPAVRSTSTSARRWKGTWSAHTGSLDTVPWTDNLKNRVEYASGHHEKLDGSGYPRGLHGKEIPLQTRLISLADIFDALTEADRPYKRALSPERALDIMRDEARAGHLDQALVDLLIDSKVYTQILHTHASRTDYLH